MHTLRSRLVRPHALVLGLASTALACAGGDAPTDPLPVTPVASVAEVQVSPAQAQVAVGATTQLAAVGRDAGGRPVSGTSASWSSLDPGIARVQGGVVTGVAAGRARVVAQIAGRADTALIDVTSGPAGTPGLARLALELDRLTLRPGTTGQLSAVARTASGAPLSGQAVTWSSTAPGVATVSGGIVTAVAIGTAQIVAAAGSFADTAVVTVSASGSIPGVVNRVTLGPDPLTIEVATSAPLTATAWDGSGGVLPGRLVAWSSAAPEVASVSATGVVTGVAVGTAPVIATIEGQADTVVVSVVRVPVADVVLATTFASLRPGETGQLNTRVRDARGEELMGRVVSYVSANPGIATVSATGLVTGVAVGSTSITATSEGKSATVAVQVATTPVTVGSVVVDPTSATLAVGATRSLTATVRNAQGQPITGQTVGWSSSAPAIATVSASGVVTAVAAGNATITATAGGKSATVAVTVTAPPNPTRTTVALATSAIGSVAGYEGSQFLMPGVLVTGEDEAAGLAPLQSFVTYSLGNVPAGGTIESASVTVTMDAEGVFGSPFGLGALVAERATSIALLTTAPGAGAVVVATQLTPSVTVDVTALVRAAYAAGAADVTIRLRFAQTRDNDGKTDQLELAVGTLSVTYLK